MTHHDLSIEMSRHLLDLVSNDPRMNDASHLYAMDQMGKDPAQTVDIWDENSPDHKRYFELVSNFQKSVLARMIIDSDGTC